MINVETFDVETIDVETIDVETIDVETIDVETIDVPMSSVKVARSAGTPDTLRMVSHPVVAPVISLANAMDRGDFGIAIGTATGIDK